MKKIIPNLFSVLFFGLSLLALVFIYVSGGNRFDNSDALYLPVLFNDILVHGGKFSDWYLTPAPYFFPDFIIFFLAFLFGPGVFSQIIIFTLLQCALVCSLLYLILRKIDVPNPFITANFIATSFVWLAISVDQPFIFILLSAYHYGAFISTLLLVYGWLIYCQAQSLNSRLIAVASLSVIAFLSSLSDAIFFIQALMPFSATIVVLYFYRRKHEVQNLLYAGIIPLAFGIIGLVSYKWIVAHRTRYSGRLGFSKFSQNLGDLSNVVIGVLQKDYLLCLIFILFFYFIFRSIRSFLSYKSTEFLGSQFICIFSVISSIATIAFVLMLQQIPISERYLISAFSWPVIVVGISISIYFERLATWLFLISSGVMCSVLLLGGIHKMTHLGVESENYPADIACIDRALKNEGGVNGIAGYWDAKRIQALSHLNLNIAQHLEDLTEQHWITSSRYFYDRYDFAVYTKDAPFPFTLSIDKIVQLNGSPKAIYHCGKSTVYFYGSRGLQVMKK